MNPNSPPPARQQPALEPERTEAFRSKVARYRRILTSFWWVPAITVSLGLAIQAWHALTSPLTYQSVGRILVSGKIALPENGMFNEEAVNFFGTQEELMQGDEVRRRAAARVQSLRPDLTAGPVDIQVNQIPRTSIFVLVASGTNADYIKAYLNAMMEEYIAFRRGIFTEKSQNTLTAITDELGRVETDLKQSETDLLDWKQKNNLSFLQEEGTSAGGYLATLNRELALLESEYNLIGKLDDEQNIDRVAHPKATQPSLSSDTQTSPDGKNDFLASTATGGPAESYMSVKRRNFILEASREQLLETRQPAHPKVKEINEEIRQNKKLLEVYRLQAVEQLKSKRQSLQAQIENTKEQIAQWETKALDLSRRMGEFDRLKGKMDRQKTLYDRLLASVQSVDVNANIQQDILSIMQYATPPGIRIQSLARDLTMGGLMGITAGLGILLVIGALDDRVFSVSEIQAIIDEEVVAIIPQVPDGQQVLKLNEDDNPGLFESLRKLRSWILFTDWEKGPPKSILVASAVSGEGKSTTALNLATCLAASGTKTLLVDADLRRGNLHHHLSVEQDPGLGNILNGEVSIDKAIHITEINNLWFIPRGHYGSQGSEIFLSTTLDHFLFEVEKRFDVIIVDSAPVLAVDETSILAGKVDVVLYSIRNGVTSLRLARRSISHMLARQAVIGGVIFNAVDPSSHEFPYYTYDYAQKAAKKRSS